jgi:hypothetical protein
MLIREAIEVPDHFKPNLPGLAGPVVLNSEIDDEIVEPHVDDNMRSSLAF